MKLDKTDKIILSLIISILLLTTLYYLKPLESFKQEPYSYYYDNGVDQFLVTRAEDPNYQGWVIKFHMQDRTFTIDSLSDPRDIENITIKGDISNIVRSRKVYFTYDPDQNMDVRLLQAEYEVGKIISNPFLYNIEIDIGSLKEIEELPFITCENATASNPVIVFTLGDETIVREENHCITISATDQDKLIMASNRFMLTLLGIMK